MNGNKRQNRGSPKLFVMQTYSHFLITAVLRKPLKKYLGTNNKLPTLKSSALIWGSFAPDLILICLTIGCIIYDYARGLRYTNEAVIFEQSTMAKLFGDWFFNNPWVITGQNLFHSPLLVSIYIFLSYLLWLRGKAWATWTFWFACACMLHTLIDIPLHHDDGPLLLFPINWSLRFISPVSYWDSNYYGQEFFLFEHTLDLILLIILLANFLKRSQQKVFAK